MGYTAHVRITGSSGARDRALGATGVRSSIATETISEKKNEMNENFILLRVLNVEAG